MRCEFRTEDDDEAAEHARDSGHMRCICCRRRFLTEFEAQTCALCVGRVRADLADIVEAFALLEPFGTTALTLLGDGTMQRHARADELGLNKRGEKVGPGYRDEWTGDPLPVLPALVSWEDFIREDCGAPKGAPDPTLTDVVGWLSSNLDSRLEIAQTFHGFDEFASDVHRLLSALQHSAGLADDPDEADPDCFDCGGPLLRYYRPPAESMEERRRRARGAVERMIEPVAKQRAAERTYGAGVTLTSWPSMESRRAMAAKAALAGTDDEGLSDEWACAWCRREYDQTSYFLALRAKASSWVSVPLAAETAQRPVKTLRSWIRRLQVMAVCRVEDRAVQVWWPDVSDRAFRHAALDDEQSA